MEPDYIQEIDLHSPPDRELDPSRPVLLPLFISEKRVLPWIEKINSLIGLGIRQFILPAYGWLPLFLKLRKVNFFTGPFVYAYNSFAYQFLLGYQVQGIGLGEEIKSEQLGEIQNYKNIIKLKSASAVVLATRLMIPDGQYKLKNTFFDCGFFEEYTVLKIRQNL
jgi:hypothetical protein